MKSNPPEPTSGSSVCAQNSRTFGSIASMRFGLKTRDRIPRCTSWMGGSSKRMFPGGSSTPYSTTALMISSSIPLAELNVFQSVRPCSTSWKRLNA